MGSTGGTTEAWGVSDGDTPGCWPGTRGIVEVWAPNDGSVAGAEPTSDWLWAWGAFDRVWFGIVLSDTGLFLR